MSYSTLFGLKLTGVVSKKGNVGNRGLFFVSSVRLDLCPPYKSTKDGGQ